MLILMLQRKKVSPKGLTFASHALAGTTSLAVRLVALWVKCTLIGSFVYRHLMAFASAVYLVICMLFGWSASLL